MDYLKEWQLIKKTFENETGKKKPSQSFIGVIRKSSGMETACTNINKAFASKKGGDVAKAIVAFESAAKAYEKVLAGAIKGEDSANARVYNACVKVMMGELAKMAKDARKDGEALESDFYFKAAEKCALEISKMQQKALKDKSVAEEQAGECDAALRAVIEAVARKDQTVAKQQVTLVGQKAKSVETIHKQIVSAHKSAAQLLGKSKQEWAGASSNSPTARLEDKATSMIDAMQMMIEDLQEDVNGCKKAVTDAGQALKGGVNEMAIYLSGGAKLAERAIKAVATLDASYREFTAAVENLGLDVINAKEMKEEGETREAFAVIKGKAEAAGKNLTLLLSNLEKNRKTFDSELKKFPQTVLNHKDFKNSKDEIERALGFFQEMIEGTKEAEVSLKKTQKKVG